MRTTSVLLSAGICSLGLVTGAFAQNPAATSDQTLPPSHTERLNDLGKPELSGPVTKMNKASKLIGMDVHNAQNQKLGDIQDFAVDLQSGRIGYAVLSVGGFLGLGEKYIAVPINELQPAPDGNGLLLNADKARIQNEPGFAKNDWPALNAVQASTWAARNEAQGTAGAVRSESGTEQQRDTLHALPNDQNPNASSTHQRMRGRITSVDKAAGTLTISDASGRQEFKMDNQAVIQAQGQPNASLDNLREGDRVSVQFHRANGANMVDRINVLNGPAQPSQ